MKAKIDSTQQNRKCTNMVTMTKSFLSLSPYLVSECSNLIKVSECSNLIKKEYKTKYMCGQGDPLEIVNEIQI